MQIPGSADDPSLFPIENPNPVFRAAAGGLILFANRASDALLASWGTRAGDRLPANWREQIQTALESRQGRRLLERCGDRVIELDLVPIPAKGYANVYGRDVTEQETARQEREAAFQDVARSEAKYRLLFDSIDEGFCIIQVLYDEHGKPVDYVFLEANAAFERQTGLVNAIGKRVREMVPLHEQYWFDLYGRIALTGEPARVEDAAVQLGRYYDLYAFRIGDPAESKVAVLFRDISERRRMEEELRLAAATLEQRVQERTAELERANRVLTYQATVLENVNDAIVAYDATDLHITAWNRRAEEQYGWTAEEALGGHAPTIVGSQLDPNTRAEIVKMVAATGGWRGELRHTRRDGAAIVVETTSTALRDGSGRVVGHVTANREITDRKRLEEELRASRDQLKDLSHRLVERQESERSFVANELYNDEGQRLAALLLELGQMEKAANSDGALEGHIDRMKELARSILADMHTLAVSLRPASLDRLGLVAALRDYAQELGAREGINLQVEASAPRDLRLGPDCETMVYRVAQEAVTNAVRHARAHQIGIVATQRQDRLVLVIEDDGRGFDVEEAVRCGGVGIVGMRERTEMLGGSLAIESEAGKGTAVYIEVPLSGDQAK